MFQEEPYLEKKVSHFFKDLGYFRGIVPRDKASKKLLKQLIETRLLMDENTKKDMKVIFSKLLVSLSFDVNYFYLKFS